jgi:hypothetical protein
MSRYVVQIESGLYDIRSARKTIRVYYGYIKPGTSFCWYDDKAWFMDLDSAWKVESYWQTKPNSHVSILSEKEFIAEQLAK